MSSLRRLLFTLASAAVLLLFAGAARAADLHVPGDYATIAVAIAGANTDDTVLLADGTYNEHDLDFGGKAITVRSQSDDPAKCILDCQQLGRGFGFHSGETAASALRGITIKNGKANYGGGISSYRSNPTLTNCTFAANTAGVNGGAIYNYSTSPTLTNCTFAGNTATDGGGGIFNHSSSATITNCILWGEAGGEFYDFNSSPTVSYSD